MISEAGSPIAQDHLERRIEYVNRMMRTHAGAIEFVDANDEGVVTVRFLGMCQGCPFRVVSMFGLVIPALEEVEGVTEVRALGVRVSEEAAGRALAAMGGDLAWPPVEHGKGTS